MTLAALADAVLELTVVGSFTRIGYDSRRRLFRWPPPRPGALAGKTALVTGASSGIGMATAEELAALGARVILAGRSEPRQAEVRDRLTARNGEDRFPVVVVDMASLASVRSAAQAIRDTEPRLDVLVDSAGAIFDERTETADGLESTLATMVVGPFALISALAPLLRQSRGRVISVASGGMYLQSVDFEDLQWRRRPWDGIRDYAQAKRIQVALIREWHRREPRRPERIRFNAMHPGWADTPGLAASIPEFHRVLGPWLRTPAQGADTIVWLASDPSAGLPGGRLYLDRRARPFDRISATRLDAAARRRLWDLVSELATRA